MKQRLLNTVILATGVATMTDRASAANALEHAAALQRQYVLIESAGVFWLAAEIAILLVLRAAARHANERPIPPVFVLRKSDRALAIVLSCCMMGVALYAPGRWFLSTPLAETLRQIADGPAALSQAVRLAYTQATRSHQLVWVAFVCGWVVLECLIVWYGIATYRALRKVLRATS